MKTTRSVSQVLTSLLPEQTADLPEGVWKVSRWEDPRHIRVDVDLLRARIGAQIAPWENAGLDNGLGRALRSGQEPTVVAPSEEDGVRVRRFPELFSCGVCGRTSPDNDRPCRCGRRQWNQERFVAYHTCGAFETPWVPLCDQHRQARIVRPRGSRNVDEIRIVCPECGKELSSRGFPRRRCRNCNNGTLTHQVHRAAVVYQPRSIALVNAPTPALARQVSTPEARVRCLEWVLGGMADDGPFSGGQTYEELVVEFMSRGHDRESAETAALALSGGKRSNGGASDTGLTDPVAQEAAVELVFATDQGRIAVEGRPGHESYAERCRAAWTALGLEAIELLPQFPVLTGTFGFTRGAPAAGQTPLRWFRGPGGAVRVHGHLGVGEALLFRLDPIVVSEWLRARGHDVPHTPDASAARRALIEGGFVPLGGRPEPGTASHAVLGLIHSLAHRVIRRISALAGIDRDSLAEYLLPQHLCFAVYASPRGDFVLGGLQALFENDLDLALYEVLHGEHRCPLDPGCQREGGACVACLHLGEPSCRLFNQHLDRGLMYAPTGYLAHVHSSTPSSHAG